MIIEFNTANKTVPEKLINKIKTGILDISHSGKKISRVEVLLKIDATVIGKEQKICEMKFSYSDGGEIVAHARTSDFQKSAEATIKKLRELVNQKVKQDKSLPDIILSSVKV